MARRVRDAILDSREARSRIRPRTKPFWKALEKGLTSATTSREAVVAGLQAQATWLRRHYLRNEIRDRDVRYCGRYF